MILYHKIGWRKVAICEVWFRKMVLAQNNCAQFAPAEKSVINMIWLLLSVSDWPIIIIGPGGLLLVVPLVFVVPLLVLWGWIAIVRTMEVSKHKKWRKRMANGRAKYWIWRFFCLKELVPWSLGWCKEWAISKMSVLVTMQNMVQIQNHVIIFCFSLHKWWSRGLEYILMWTNWIVHGKWWKS